MNPSEKLITFFSKLLNKSVSIDTQISLSSAQKARTYDWLLINRLTIDELILQNIFSIRQLLQKNNSEILDADVRSHSNVYGDRLISSNENSCVGVDIQLVHELFPDQLPLDPKDDTTLRSIFTLRELSYAQSKKDPKITLAGIFSAKEAIYKCIKNVNSKKNSMLEIEISFDLNGAPVAQNFNISISHSGDYSIAVATPKISDQKSFALDGNIQNKNSNELNPPENSLRLLGKNIRPIDFIFIFIFIFILILI